MLRQIFSLSSQQNGFTILMQNACRFTDSQSGKMNRKLKLRKDLVDWIHHHGGDGLLNHMLTHRVDNL